MPFGEQLRSPRLLHNRLSVFPSRHQAGIEGWPDGIGWLAQQPCSERFSSLAALRLWILVARSSCGTCAHKVKFQALGRMVDSRIMADEQEITFDESAVAEPEIEADECSEQEPVKEPDESAAAEGDRVEAGCPIVGAGAPRCGRRLHNAPDGVDEFPICLMHSKDRNKQSGPHFGEFWREFERILTDAAEGKAHFEYFVFPRFYFGTRIFKAICHFHFATFTQYSIFSEARFMQDADFSRATFMQGAIFSEARFMQGADFGNATFTQGADFGNATFTQGADFSEATFAQMARFSKTKFYGTAGWCVSNFLDRAEFRQTKFEPSIEGKPSAVFALAKFSKPGEIVFDDVDLSRALFHNCDVSQVSFTSSATWTKRDGNRGLAVFEERVLLEKKFAKVVQEYGPFDYRSVEQIYRQLKKNFDSRLDYWTANEFHLGEMEMKRLDVPTRGRFLWLRQTWHRKLSFVVLYRWASDYGNSYWKPLLLLLGIILFLFPALLPIPGIELKHQGTTQDSGTQIETETYLSVWNVQKTWGENLSAEASLVDNCAYNALDAATFQRSAKYPPAYPHKR